VGRWRDARGCGELGPRRRSLGETGCGDTTRTSLIRAFAADPRGAGGRTRSGRSRRGTPGVAASAAPGTPGVMSTDARPREELREMFSELARTGDQGLRSQLVEAHIGLAHHLARRFVYRGEAYDDLVQVGSLALIKAVDRFDPDRGVEFTTFASKTILGELKRHFRDKGWAIRAPRRLQELYLHLNQSVASLSQVLG